jgi:hypothetical protein
MASDEEYAARYAQVVGESELSNLTREVHIRGGPCVNTAPSFHKFTDDFRYVTCQVCKVTVALVRDGRKSIVGWEAESERVLSQLRGDPDPYAKALWEAQKAKEAMNQQGLVEKFHEHARRQIAEAIEHRLRGDDATQDA